jgi:type IV secretory pathway VirB4 component
MMSLREYRSKADRIADFLPWAALVAPGVVLNKDGSFQRSARFRGPDLDSATPAELVSVTARLNSALRRLVQAGRSSSRQRGTRRRITLPAIFPIPPPLWSSANGLRSLPRKAHISRAAII